MKVLFGCLVVMCAPVLGLMFGVLSYDTKPQQNRLSAVVLGASDSIDTEASVIDILRRTELKASLTPGTRIFNCAGGCFYAALDKQHSLPATFVPEVVPTNLQGGGQLTPETVKALTKMFADLNQNDIDVEITSAYRSYDFQGDVFRNWQQITRLRQPGLSEPEVFKEANRTAALPGHSEHQLGTTVDVNTVGATPLKSQGNERLYSFISSTAHRYGFIVSYPEDKQQETGYVYEPWHIRYVGVDVATNLFNADSFVSKYLRQQGYSD